MTPLAGAGVQVQPGFRTALAAYAPPPPPPPDGTVKGGACLFGGEGWRGEFMAVSGKL